MEIRKKSLLVVHVLLVSSVLGINRYYYIAAMDVWWNYAPSGRNLVTNNTSSQRHIEPGEDRIGSTYRKAILKQYTNDLFTKLIPQPPWQGILGPTIKAETNDTVFVYFKNAASHPYGLHPHGILYEKDAEGALYADGTAGRDKLDDVVQPGETFVYKWVMKESFAPTEDDDACIPQGYHSHIRSHKDVDTGVMGILLVCKKGTLNPDGTRKDKDKEFFIYADINNETNSNLIEHSLERCLNPEKCRQLFREKNGGFVFGTFIYSINGYIYGNGPDFEVTEGDRVVIYCMGLNLGVHTISIQGQTFTVLHKSTDHTEQVENNRKLYVRIYVRKDMAKCGLNERVSSYQFGLALFEGYNMVARSPGRWLMYCRVTGHFNEGMAAFMTVKPAKNKYPPKHIYGRMYGRTRRYYIAAEEVVWDYRPSGKVLARVGKKSTERSKTEEQFFTSDSAVGGKYVKAIFMEYTDGSFTKLKPRCNAERHMGILGPAIRVEVGERLEVIFKNKANHQFSFYAFGLTVTKEYEGALYKNNRNSEIMTGRMTQPGQIQKYIFTATLNDGPTKTDPQCITSNYRSFSDYSKDLFSGLVGPLLICKRGTLDAQGKQRGFDREFFLMFLNWNELGSLYMNQSLNLAVENGKKVNTTSPQYGNNNRMRALNGRVFGNIDGFDMCLGDTVVWHLIGVGDSIDLHSAIFEGNNVNFDGRQLNHFFVVPGNSETAYMRPDNPGIWLLYNGQLGFQTEGMVTKYHVRTCNSQPNPSTYAKPHSTVRRYYIAAVDIVWDYIPNKLNTITMTDLRDPNTPGNIFVRNDDRYIGSVYKKAVYREFTDRTFTKKVKRSRKEKHLGLLGPKIKAEIGDTIEIIYKNMASFDNSIALVNLLADNHMTKMQKQGVKTGDAAVYRWTVPERSGPGPNEPNCVGNSYMSPVFPKRDLATGLLGPLIICRKGILDVYGNRKDKVSEEYVIAYVIFLERESHYFNENLKRYAPNRTNVNEGLFQTSIRRYSMNGFSWSNIPYLYMSKCDHIVWYTFSHGNIGDHSNHIHGQTFIVSTTKKFRNDVSLILPGGYETLEMLADNPGIWMIHCHIGIHVSRGMFGVYRVFPNKRAHC